MKRLFLLCLLLIMTASTYSSNLEHLSAHTIAAKPGVSRTINLLAQWNEWVEVPWNDGSTTESSGMYFRYKWGVKAGDEQSLDYQFENRTSKQIDYYYVISLSGGKKFSKGSLYLKPNEKYERWGLGIPPQFKLFFCSTSARCKKLVPAAFGMSPGS
jgi:hypothetical protein